MRSLLLALALVCGIQATVVPRTVEDLDIRQVAGTWHSMAMAASDISLLDTETAPLRVYIQELRPTPQDNLEIVLHEQENHACVKRTIMAQKTEDPAVFTVDYQGERKISMLDTDYTHYMFFCVEAPLPTTQSGVMCQYLGTWRSGTRAPATPKQQLQTTEGERQVLPGPTHGSGTLLSALRSSLQTADAKILCGSWQGHCASLGSYRLPPGGRWQHTALTQ
uniref:Lipocalin/cytosolic fatty-acid binding domain-containing protein n=1 Tax=Canis lupus dingo TaxID=286419 RepID=A0A8C0JIF7_CANLU